MSRRENAFLKSEDVTCWDSIYGMRISFDTQIGVFPSLVFFGFATINHHTGFFNSAFIAVQTNGSRNLEMAFINKKYEISLFSFIEQSLAFDHFNWFKFGTYLCKDSLLQSFELRDVP